MGCPVVATYGASSNCAPSGASYNCDPYGSSSDDLRGCGSGSIGLAGGTL